MPNVSSEILQLAHKEVVSTIQKCEKIQPKFKHGTAQYTLLVNRIKAMYISKILIENELKSFDLDNPSIGNKNIVNNYTNAELSEALRPVQSIIHKCETAQMKHSSDSVYYNRIKRMIDAMNTCKSLIEILLQNHRDI